MNILFRIALVLAVVGVAACASTVDQTTDRYLENVSNNVAAVAKRIGVPIERGATVVAARSDGGVAVFSPSSDQGGFVGWLDLASTHACAARLPAAYYVVQADVTQTEALLTLRQVDGDARLVGLRVAVELVDDDEPVTPMARIALGPDQFLLGRWDKCSDGLGHCGIGLTLNASTHGCTQ